MKIKVVYRNYKPIHELYRSFIIQPPNGIQYIIPEPKSYLKRLLPIFKKLGHIWLVNKFIQILQERFFESGTNKSIDLLEYSQMLPSKIPSIPFIIDIEHIVGLSNFVGIDRKIREKIFSTFTHRNCKGIIAFSNAAKKTIKKLLGSKFAQIEEKIRIIYPALPCNYKEYRNEVDYSIVGKDSKKLKLLFVGNDIYRKGLPELLEAFKVLEKENYDIMLFVVSDIQEELKNKYKSPNIKFFKPRFSKDMIIKQLFIPCDVFILPTHWDTFGMVFLDALSSGTPVITTKQFAIPEIIQDGYNGFLVQSENLLLNKVSLPTREDDTKFTNDLKRTTEEDLIYDLISRIKLLYSNKDLLRKVSTNTIKDFQKNGKFSIETRNKKLKRIYKEATG